MNHTDLATSRKICDLTDDFNKSEFVWIDNQKGLVELGYGSPIPMYRTKSEKHLGNAMILEELLDWLDEQEVKIKRFVGNNWGITDLILGDKQLIEAENWTEAASKAVLIVLEK